MSFTVTLTQLLYFAVGLILAIVLYRLIAERKDPNKDGFWSRIFKSNTEFDTTIGIPVFAFIILMLIFHFHDQIKDGVDYILLMAVMGLRELLGIKKNGNHVTKKT